MNKRAPALSACLLLLATTALSSFPPGALAAPAPGAWSDYETLATANPGPAQEVDISVDSRGNAMAVWTESNGTRYDIWADYFDAGSGWSGAVRVEDDNASSAYSPSVALDEGGNATAAWRQTANGRVSVLGSRYTPGAGWGPAQLLEDENNGSVQLPQVAANGQGGAMVLCSIVNGTQRHIGAMEFDPAAGWAPAQRIDSAAGNADDPSIGYDPAGNAVAVWWQDDGTRFNLWSNYHAVGAGWGAAQLIESDNLGSAFLNDVAVDRNGNAVAVWQQMDATRTNIWSNRYAAGAGWGTATLIETDNAGSAGWPDVAVDPQGNAVAVWMQSDGTRYNTWANRYVAGSGWGSAQLIESNNTGPVQNPHVALDGVGNAMAVWEQYDGARVTIWSNQFEVGSGWRTPRLAERDDTATHASPQVGVDAHGNAVAAWVRWDGINQDVVGATFTEDYSPALSISAPAEGSHSNVSAVLVQGSTEPGARVWVQGTAAFVEPNGAFSAYAPLGPNTTAVTILAQDTVGNNATATVNVTFDDPAPALAAQRDALQAQLAQAQADLAAARSLVNATVLALAMAQGNATALAGQLATLERELNDTQMQLAFSQAGEAAARQELADLQADQNATQAQLAVATANLSAARASMSALQSSYSNLSAQYNASVAARAAADAQVSALGHNLSITMAAANESAARVDALEAELEEEQAKERAQAQAATLATGLAVVLGIVAAAAFAIAAVTARRARRPPGPA